MNSKQTAAMVIVIVVIVAAVVAVVMTRDNGGGETPASADVSAGALYGNVNGDGYIDETDVEVIQGIMDGRYSADDYPLADANLDSVVDQNDLDIVNAVINQTGTTLIVVDADGEPVEISYPVTSFAISSGSNMKSIMSAIGMSGLSSLKGIAMDTEDISTILDSELSDRVSNGDIVCLTEDSRKLTTESLNLLTQNGIGLVISEQSGMSTEDSVVQAMEGLGITYLDLNIKNYEDQIQACKTLGILLDCEEGANAYIDWSESIVTTIRDSLGDQYGTKTVLCVTMSNSVSGTSSDYYAASELAGGDNIADWEDSTLKFAEGDNWLLDSKYNADYMFHFRTLVYPDGMTESQIATYAGYFEDTYTYQNGGYYLINGSLPLPVRLAVMAETMYGDCFEDGWAESVFQEYVTDILGEDYDVSQSVYIWNA